VHVIEGGRLPVWSWATDAEGVTLDQALNLADLRADLRGDDARQVGETW
jgi:hypothetical protein